jgi:putative IMPACT (imprinted ancient) family translation regulator
MNALRPNHSGGAYMSGSYRMLKSYADTYFIEKKSKFISYVQPVYTEEEALQFLGSIRKKQPTIAMLIYWESR